MAVLRRKGNTVVVRRVDVVKGVKCCFHVARGRLMIVRREEGVNRIQIRTRADCEPTDTTNKALIRLFAANLSGRVAVCLTLRDGIDG